MATTFTLVVILPNARRVNIKSNPNTIILQILEDVCKKQELNPIEWDLTHHNKVVDLGNSIRFSGIPNNGTLEMVQSTKVRKESSINLGIQLESGKRLQHPFLPHQTLWEVLEYWASQGENVYPVKDNEMETQAVCIYMRQEVLGEAALKSKTLRSLGLTQGSAMIRLLHRSESQLKHQANVSGPLSRTVSVASNETVVPSKHPPPKVVEIPKEITEQAPVEQKQSEPMDVSPPPNLRISPDPVVASHRKAGDQTQDKRTIDIKAEIMQTSESQQSLPPAITNAQRYSKEGQFHVLGLRDAILFHGDDVKVSTSQDLLQDDFFEVTVNDVRKMFKDLRERTLALEGTPLQTKSARDLEKDTAILRNLHDYPNTVVRIRFGNRYVLQGTFRTADTISSVESWLREFLNNQKLNFYLFETPPKKIFQKETRLVEEGLVGMAVIYFGSDDGTYSNEQNVLKPDVYEKVSDPVAAFDFIRKKLRKEKLDSTRLSSEDQQSSSTTESQAAQGPSSGNGASGSGSTSARRQPALQPRAAAGSSDNTGNAPKWFKLAK